MPDINWGQIADDLIQVGIAYLLALPVAWDRAHEERSAGLRTLGTVGLAPQTGQVTTSLFRS